MSRFDFRIEVYEVDSKADEKRWGAKPHVWEITTEKAKPIVLDEQLGESQEEAGDKAARAAKKYIAERTVEDA
jgi:hypothetical protein